MAQTLFLRQEELVWSLQAAKLGERDALKLSHYARALRFAGNLLSSYLPSVFVRSRPVLTLSTALAMVRNEGSASNENTCVACSHEAVLGTSSLRHCMTLAACGCQTCAATESRH